MHATERSETARDMLALYGHYLEHGRFFRPQPLPRGFRRGKPHQCYGNAFDLAVRNAGLVYCEGFVLFSLGSRATEMEHGWCVAADRRVLELTLRQVGLSYFGIPYRPEQLAGHRVPGPARPQRSSPGRSRPSGRKFAAAAIRPPLL
jgi:hypothetical protein